MTESVLQQFARLLASEPEVHKREQMMARAKMLAMESVPDEAFEPPVVTFGDYIDTPIEIPPSLVWPTIVVRREITATLGRAGKGKTTMNLNRVMKWAAGVPMFASFKSGEGETYLNPSHPLKTLIIENEGSAGMFHQKMGNMLNAEGYLTVEQRRLVRENLLIWGDGGYQGLKLDDPKTLNMVREGCEKWSPDIVFIEPFRGLWKGDENSSTDMAVVVDNLIAMATDYDCGIVLSHHERKSGAGEDGELMSAGRGSTVLEGAVAVMENFQSVKNGDYREMTWSKARYLPPPPPTRLEYMMGDGWYAHIPTTDIEASIIEAIQENDEEPMSIKDLAENLGETQTKLRPLLEKLCKDSRLKKMPSQQLPGGGGTTGNRYRLPTGHGDGAALGF